MFNFLKRLFARKSSPQALKPDGYFSTLPQITPAALPEPSEAHPVPWHTLNRGGGHISIFDKNGTEFAHVHCCDGGDILKLGEKLGKANHGIFD